VRLSDIRAGSGCLCLAGASTGRSIMSISVIEPIGWALRRTWMILFRGFSLRKWFVLGFCAWLAALADGSLPLVPPIQLVDEMNREMAGDPGLFVLVVIAAVAVVITVALVLLWISSRGWLMFLDGVVHNRGAVKEPWRQFRERGDSLFRFRVALGVGGIAGFILIGGACLWVAWPDIDAEEFRTGAVVAIVLGGVLLVPFGIALALVGAVLRDFIVPVMFIRNVPVGVAWDILRRDLLPGRGWVFVRFYLMRFLLGLTIWIVAMLPALLFCCCCLDRLPYVGALIGLPWHVFSRCYPLYVLEQLGTEWCPFLEGPVSQFDPAAPPPLPPPAP